MKPSLRILEIEIDFGEVNIIERMQYFRNDKIRIDRRKFVFYFGRSSTMKKDCDFFPNRCRNKRNNFGGQEFRDETRERMTFLFIVKQIL